MADQCTIHKNDFIKYCETCYKLLCGECLEQHTKPPLSHSHVILLESVSKILVYEIMTRIERYKNWKENSLPLFVEQANSAQSFINLFENEILSKKIEKVNKKIKKLEKSSTEKIDSLNSDLKMIDEAKKSSNWKIICERYSKIITSKDSLWIKLMKKERDINDSIGQIFNEGGKIHLSKINQNESSRKEEQNLKIMTSLFPQRDPEEIKRKIKKKEEELEKLTTQFNESKNLIKNLQENELENERIKTEIKENANALSSYNIRLKEARTKLDSLNTEINNIKETLEKTKGETEICNKNCSEYKNKYNEIQNSMSSYQITSHILTEEIKKLEETKTKLNNESAKTSLNEEIKAIPEESKNNIGQKLNDQIAPEKEKPLPPRTFASGLTKKKSQAFVPVNEAQICASCQKSCINPVITLYCGHIICDDCIKKAFDDVKLLKFTCVFCKADNPISKKLYYNKL